MIYINKKILLVSYIILILTIITLILFQTYTSYNSMIQHKELYASTSNEDFYSFMKNDSLRIIFLTVILISSLQISSQCYHYLRVFTKDYLLKNKLFLIFIILIFVFQITYYQVMFFNIHVSISKCIFIISTVCGNILMYFFYKNNNLQFIKNN